MEKKKHEPDSSIAASHGTPAAAPKPISIDADSFSQHTTWIQSIERDLQKVNYLMVGIIVAFFLAFFSIAIVGILTVRANAGGPFQTCVWPNICSK